MNKTCLNCNETFYANRKTRLFCCVKCFHDHRSNNAYKKNSKWSHSMRRHSINLLGENCQQCNATPNEKIIHTHHLDHNSNNNPIDGSNWMRLCTKCHSQYHVSVRPLRKKERIVKICQQCDIEYLVEPWKKEISKYCSKKCRSEHDKARVLPKSGFNKKCIICKKSFYVMKCQKNKKYCSLSCKHKGHSKSMKGKLNSNYKHGEYC